jgi:hypothetical protein
MTAWALILLLVWNLTLAAQDDRLHIVVLEGEGAINNVRSPRAKQPVVRVEDAKNQCVPGAAVTFVLPANGAGAVFGDGAGTLTLTTDDRGEAMARGLHANRLPGAFQIRINASKSGRMATASITQTNVDPGAHTSSRTIAILAIVGAAAAGGAAVALRGGKSQSAATSATPTVVVAGAPSLGGPQ